MSTQLSTNAHLDRRALPLLSVVRAVRLPAARVCAATLLAAMLLLGVGPLGSGPVGGGLVTPSPASAATGELTAGSTLVAGASVWSADGRYQLAMQRDGNAVVYSGSTPLWSSRTAGHAGAVLAMQTDGNLVVYSGRQPLWASGTSGSSAVLVMQSDGNLVLYLGSRAAWATGPAPRQRLLPGDSLTPGQRLSANGYTLTLQSDGNLVGNGPLGRGWSTGTAGQSVSQLLLQRDGNLVLYDRAGRALWASATSGATQAVLQNDANLVLYNAAATPLWAKRVAFFATSRPLTAAERTAMTGMTWRSGCPVPLSDLRAVTLTYVDFTGEPRDGTLVVRSSVVGDVTAVFGKLHAERFPIRTMVPIEAYGGSDDASMAADNTSAFNCRTVAGSSTWSRHAYGTAIDINPVENPYVSGSSVSPPAGASYLNRSSYRPGMLVTSSTAVREFEARGWQWGGRWTSAKDYQHVDR